MEGPTMIKLVFCIRRLPHLTLEEFSHYWSGVHAKIGMDAGAALPVHRYVQTHRLERPENELLRAARGADEPYDGVAELWWKSEAEMTAALESPEGRKLGKALLEDERNFIDLERSSVFLAEERVFVGEPTP